MSFLFRVNLNGVCVNLNGVCVNLNGICVNLNGVCVNLNGICVNPNGICVNLNGDSDKRNTCENMQKTVYVVFNQAITLHISYIKTSAEAYRIVQITGKIYLLDFGNMGEGNHRDVRSKK